MALIKRKRRKYNEEPQFTLLTISTTLPIIIKVMIKIGEVGETLRDLLEGIKELLDSIKGLKKNNDEVVIKI